MKIILKLVFLILTYLNGCYKTAAQQTDTYTTQIDRLITRTQPRSFNGVVYLQQNGKTLYAKAAGYADFDKKIPLKIEDRFSTMSIAKQITAALLLQQVENGTIDLQVPIRQYLPDFKYTWADTITVHQLLNNSSGLSSEELNKPLRFKPGTAFGYSNIGYYVAGLVLEKQTGKSFQTLVTDLFLKCNMRNSTYPTTADTTTLTKGHTIKADNSYRLNQGISFAPDLYFGSHLVVTAPDLAKWNNCLHNGKVLKPATYKKMIQYNITNTHSLFGEQPIGYGYGLRINDQGSLFEIGHTGYHPREGFTAVNLYYPKSNTSLIILENVGHENFAIAYYFEHEIRKIVQESNLLK